MKLLSMHVDNFGRLHDYDYEFDDGLNIILEENGWGKTTMAAFLKAMLYGFDSGLSRDITENERKRYSPWQGGVYGGTLDFEADGVTYRVRRTFGENQRFDSVKIINLETGEPVRIAAGSLGEELFKLDAGAFQRIVFVNQSGADDGAGTESIQNRLNSLIAHANNTASYEAAIADLSQLTRVYEKNDGRGQLDSINRNITEKQTQSDLLEREVREQEAARERVRDITAELEEVRTQIETQKDEYDKAVDDRRKLEASRKLLEDVSGEIGVLTDRLDMMRIELGGSVPEDAAIDQNRRNMDAVEELTARIERLETEAEETTAAYREIFDRYQGDIPEANVLDRIRQVSGELQGVKKAYEEEAAAAREETVPAGYTAVCEAVAADSSYPETLRSVIGTENAVQDLIRMKDSNRQALAHEEESWKNTQTRFASLTKDVEVRQADLDRLKEYDPEKTAPGIAKINELSSRRQDLNRQKESLEAMLQKEADEWEVLKGKFRDLKAETAAVQSELDGMAECSPERIKPYLDRLAEVQKMEQAVSIRQEALERNKITEEEKGILEANKDPLPEPGEADRMKVIYRRIMQEQAEKDSYTQKIDTEKVKAEDLNTQLLKIDEIKDADLTPVEEPAKGYGTLLIVLGVIALIAGAAAAVMVSLPLAAIAVLGLALIIFGLISGNKYRKAYAEYEAYVTETERRKTEKEQKKAEIRDEIDLVQKGIVSLNGSLEESSARMKDDEREVIRWVQRYGRSEKLITEEVLTRIGINAERLRVLRAKAKDQKETRDYIRKQTDYINGILAHTEALYKDAAGMSADEAADCLRKKETEYRLVEGRLAAAKEAEKKFLEENKCTEEQLNDETPFEASEARQKMTALEAEFNRLEEERWEVDSNYEGLGGLSYEEAAEYLRKKSEAYKVAEAQLQAARQNEAHYLVEAGVTREAIARPDSEKTDSLKKAKAEIDRNYDNAVSRIRESLAPVGIETTGDNVLDALKAASLCSTEYANYSRILAERAHRQTRREKQIADLEYTQAVLLEQLKGCYEEEPLDTRLDLVRADITEASRLAAKRNELKEESSDAETRKKQAETDILVFENTYGRFASEGEDVFAAVCQKKEEYKNTLNEMAPLLRQREAIVEEQESMPDDGGERENALRRSIQMLEARRDALVSENSRKQEFIRQTERSAELLPDVKRELSQMYEQRESALNELGMLKRAMRTISEARENLAGRYLGKVEQLFNDYMQIWLGNDAVRGILDIDFNVSIEENDRVHVAEGYSTGYYDMMDFCMRLALIDTLFENEQPFLILDDPFVNLDEERLEKALELLSAMSASRQIVYFVCHPVRAVKGDGTAQDKDRFRGIARKAQTALNERMAAMPARTNRAADALIDRWHVAESAGALPFVINGTDRELSGPVFTLSFRMAGNGIHPDRMYELFFIDEQGHVLNEPRLLEIRNERVLPSSLTFGLSPREDSGTQYQLLAREVGSTAFNVDAAIPFTAAA